MKWKAATLIEVLVAMAVVVMVFGMGMLLWGNLNSHAANPWTERARYACESQLALALSSQDAELDPVWVEGLEVETAVRPSATFEQLLEIRVTARLEDDIIYSCSQLLIDER